MKARRNELGHELAVRACQFCSLRKKKCDRTLPTCLFCVKHHQTCEYRKQDRRKNLLHDQRSWHHESQSSSGDRRRHRIDDASITFLDPGLLQLGQITMPLVPESVSQDVLQALGSPGEMRLAADRYFELVHLWMPFISKQHFYERYLRSSPTRPDVVLLLLALKLISTIPSATNKMPRTALYSIVKHFYVDAESCFSIHVLQAGILVALYELGHGIYPAAYLSIGTCARYAYSLGINTSPRVPSRRVLTLLEVEERRRAWWAIVILDRFVSIGCPGRPLATANPTLDDLLPADDAAWDQGVVKLDSISTISSPMTSHMSKFALLCQAARLLGYVLEHLWDESGGHDDGTQLDRTLQSMLAAALNVDVPDYDQITFIYSALVSLNTSHSSHHVARDKDSDCHKRADHIMQQIMDQVDANIAGQHCFVHREPDAMSPWGLFFAYRVCVSHIGSPRKTPRSIEIIKSLREGFVVLEKRWSVASLYLQLLEAHEAAYLGIGAAKASSSTL